MIGVTEVQPGGYFRQDVPAGLGLPNHHTGADARRNAMVGPLAPAQTDEPVVTGAECVVWRGGERIYATVVSAISVGLPLRMLLPADVRHVLVECALAAVVGVTVAVRPGVLVRLARAATGVVSVFGEMFPPPALGGVHETVIQTRKLGRV